MYCNYSKDKFNNEVTYICPSWIENIPKTFTVSIKDDWGELFPEYSYNEDARDFLWALAVSEKLYLSLLEAGWKPQQARNILPLATKCDMVMTGFMSDWNHFCNLRSNKYGTGGAHPQASELADSLYETLNLL